MQLQQVEIRNFKSIKSTRFTVTSNQLCFVGANESGKSSVLEAISYLDFDRDFPVNVRNKQNKVESPFPIITAVFSISAIENQFIIDKEVIQDEKIKEKFTFSHKISTCQVKRWGNGLENIDFEFYENDKLAFSYQDSLKDEKNIIAVFIDTFIRPIYPTIELFNDEDLSLKPATLAEIQSTAPEFETLRRLIHLGGCTDISILNNDDYEDLQTELDNISARFTNLFQEHYKQDKIVIAINTPNHKFTVTIKDSSNISFKISERSPGFREYFAFLINKLYTNAITKNTNNIFLLDEPARGLHPKGAKDLLKTFDKIAKESMIFYTTHNPFLVLRNRLDSLYLVKKCKIEGSTIQNKPYRNAYEVIRKELGIMLNDSFVVGELNIVVEGATEKLIIERVRAILNYTDMEWVNIYNAESCSKIKDAVNYIGPNGLKFKGIALFDSDVDGIKEKQALMKILEKKDIKDWECIDLNEIIKTNPEKTIEDLFKPQTYIDAFNKYCKEQEGYDTFEKTFEPYKIDKNQTKIKLIDTLHSYYISFIAEEKKMKASTNKPIIATYALNAIEELNIEEQTKELVHFKKMLDTLNTKLNILHNL